MKKLISAKNLTIQFPILSNSHRSFKKAFLNISTGGRINGAGGSLSTVTALEDVNLSIEEGARVGLFGHNGSGKSTLLRVFSGIYAPTKGAISTAGRIASLLDLSMGLDMDATGYENIYLRGILDGLHPKRIRNKIEEIADFTELGEYLNLPIRTYSSGMMLRLAFAISTSIDADILIMDEWLSVGDQNFSLKASKRLEELIGRTAILVIATHDSDLINSICNRKITLEHGRVISDEIPQKLTKN